jgi:Ca2+:H+ antiporter
MWQATDTADYSAGFFYYESTFQMTAAQASSSLMTLACITLILPAAYHASLNDGSVPLDPSSDGDSTKSLHGLLVLSRGTSIILLCTYIGYLFFQLKTHAQLFEAEQEDEEEEEPDMDQYSAGIWLVIVTVVTAFCADVLVGSIDETAQQYHIPKQFIGLILLPVNHAKAVSCGKSRQSDSPSPGSSQGSPSHYTPLTSLRPSPPSSP